MLKVNVIGSGFSSLSASCYLAQAGYEVHVFEKNQSLGGRASVLKRDGFTFDMGPSWYWMPDIFERFFADFNKKPSDYYELIKLSPAYSIYFGSQSKIEISDQMDAIRAQFEGIERGSAKQLDIFMAKAKRNYEVAMGDLVYEPGESILELITKDTVGSLSQFFTSIHKDIKKRFKDKRLIQVLEFPVLFLGAKPENTPSFYSFMNYADFGLGTWYPLGGMYKVVEAMVNLAKELGVQFHTDTKVLSILTQNKDAIGIETNQGTFLSDITLSGADYVHTEKLLPTTHRMYSDQYWDKKTFAPSALLFFVAFDKKLKNINHHSLFFDTDFSKHSEEIYDKAVWPEAPLFYANFPSVTDPEVAPEGKECAFFLIPLAPDLKDDKQLHTTYFNQILDRFEHLTKQSVKEEILFMESFSVDDFKNAYNSFKGNAYGMANTLRQTAFLRPKIKSSKVNNLYFTGQLTVPGPGVPPALISGKIAANLITKYQSKNTHDAYL